MYAQRGHEAEARGNEHTRRAHQWLKVRKSERRWSAQPALTPRYKMSAIEERVVLHPLTTHNIALHPSALSLSTTNSLPAVPFSNNNFAGMNFGHPFSNEESSDFRAPYYPSLDPDAPVPGGYRFGCVGQPIRGPIHIRGTCLWRFNHGESRCRLV